MVRSQKSFPKDAKASIRSPTKSLTSVKVIGLSEKVKNQKVMTFLLKKRKKG